MSSKKTNRKLNFTDYANTIGRNYGKYATPLMPHVNRAIESLRAGAARRSAQKVKIREKSKRQAPINQRAEQDGTGGSYSTFNYGKYKLSLPKSVVAELAKNTRMFTAALQVTNGAGLQAVTDIHSFFTTADMLLLAGITGQTNGKALMLKVRAETIITNATLSTGRITIYDIIARRDLNNATLTGPTTAWKQGLADQGGGANQQLLVGSTPFSSKSFTQYFKVKQVTHVLLAQGATHIHRVNYSPNRGMDWGTLDYGSIFSNLTCFQVLVQHGQVDDAVTGFLGPSTGSCKLNIVTTKEYETSWIADATTSYTSSNTLPTTFTGGESLVDVGTGTVTANATA